MNIDSYLSRYLLLHEVDTKYGATWPSQFYFSRDMHYIIFKEDVNKNILVLYAHF